jgi:hypothetical protein
MSELGPKFQDMFNTFKLKQDFSKRGIWLASFAGISAYTPRLAFIL